VRGTIERGGGGGGKKKRRTERDKVGRAEEEKGACEREGDGRREGHADIHHTSVPLIQLAYIIHHTSVPLNFKGAPQGILYLYMFL
jgi:hypothetical protein